MPRKNPLLRREALALVLVDMQEKLLPHIHGHEDVLANCVRLASFARIMRLPVLVCEQVKLGDTVAPLRKAVGDVAPIVKSSFSCFGARDFMQALEREQVSTLLLAGIESHVCILQTALHALVHRTARCSVHLAADATGSRAPHNRDLALERLRQAGVIVSSTEAAIFELMGTAECAEFKQVLPLVK